MTTCNVCNQELQDKWPHYVNRQPACRFCSAKETMTSLLDLQPGESEYLYLDDVNNRVTNGSCAFDLKVKYIFEGNHNWRDVKQLYSYFQLPGGFYYIVRCTTGGMNQVARVTRLKHKPDHWKLYSANQRPDHEYASMITFMGEVVEIKRIITALHSDTF